MTLYKYSVTVKSYTNQLPVMSIDSGIVQADNKEEAEKMIMSRYNTPYKLVSDLQLNDKFVFSIK